MGAVFSAAPGMVVKIDSGRMAVPFHIGLEDFGARNTIATQIGITAEGNQQFLHTIGDFIYLYTFGDRIAELTVGGIAFAGACRGGPSGSDGVLDYYIQNRTAVRARPIGIQFGQKAFAGFLTGLQLNMNDPEMQLGQFFLRFHTFSGG